MVSNAMSEIQATASELEGIAEVTRLVERENPLVRLTVGDHEVELPPSLVALITAGAGALGQGSALTLMREEAEVSPAEAAKLLGVSRQYVDRLVAKGVLPVRRMPHSQYRKIPARSVLAHLAVKQSKREGLASILDAAEQAPLEDAIAAHDFDGDGDVDLLGTAGATLPVQQSYWAPFVWARNDDGAFNVLSNIDNTGMNQMPGNDPDATFTPRLPWRSLRPRC